MKPPISYAVAGERTSPLWCAAFARGCKGSVSAQRALQPGDVALFGSPRLWPLLQHAQLEERTWYYGDHAYIGRDRMYRITRNGYQHNGLGTPDHGRFRAFGRPIQPWTTRGAHVLLCPQSATYFALFGIDVQQWIVETTDALVKYTDRPMRLRWKAAASRPIGLDLENCWAVVTFSSSAAIDALIAGVPVFTLATFASTYRMGTPELSQIEAPVYPEDRESFMGVLAANQFSLSEMRGGRAWRALGTDAPKTLVPS